MSPAFAPSLDGHIRVFDAHKGAPVRAINTRIEFAAVNAPTATGGAIGPGGVYLDAGQLFVNAGNGTLGRIAGNTLIVMALSPN